MAERLMAARERIQRWSARDFKRRQTPHGLTHTQFAILAAVPEPEGLNMSALAERLDLSVPTVVRAVDALERKGLVTRQRSRIDHREVAIVVTPDGATIHNEVRLARRDRLMRVLASLSDEELEGFLRGYEALARALTTIEAADNAAAV
jgi:DNA-binding MarR family transcriptional regulator